MNDLSESTLRTIERVVRVAPALTPDQLRAMLHALVLVAFAEGALSVTQMLRAVPAASEAIAKARAM